jgi:sugar phosphate permease
MEGGGLLTPVMGSFIDRFGFHSSFTIASAAIVTVTLICSLFLRGSQD